MWAQSWVPKPTRPGATPDQEASPTGVWVAAYLGAWDGCIQRSVPEGNTKREGERERERKRKRGKEIKTGT